ncbi:MAG: four helix bundle protein [Candidatus Buchananbacteria bacterium]
MFRFEELEIWKLSITYARLMYGLANNFPKIEQFALADQLRRVAVSISNNIAEGSGGTSKDFSNFLSIAIKSTLETVNILYIAKTLSYISENERIRYYQEAEKND